MKVLVTGAAGQLGRSAVSLWSKSEKHEVISLTKSDLDIANETQVMSTVEAIKPDAILHCAAYTNVEAAEDTSKELNWLVNRDASGTISKAASMVSSKLIYISTDYVFDGAKSEPYEVTDKTNPLNEYGAAKLAGEHAVLEHSPLAHIIRTSWVFEERGHNFVNTMLRLSQTRDVLKVVNDQWGCPTYAPDLAEFMMYLLDNDISGGIYHFSNDGEATWFDFAKSILSSINGVKIFSVDSSDFVQKAKRPRYSVLSLAKAKETGFSIRPWQDALEAFKRNI